MDVTEMIERNDPDELLREIDRLCERRDWPAILRLRDLARAATERGKTVWGAAGHAEYRLALEAPAEFAAPMVEADPGRFVLGPLTEVAASTHTWSELEPYLPPGPLRATVAYERIVRGENLAGQLPEATVDFGLPLELQAWEPDYAVVKYDADKIEQFGSVALFDYLETAEVVPAADVEFIDDPAIEALAALTREWTSNSNGDAQVVGVNGGLNEVLSGFSARTALRLVPEDALRTLAWAGSSGGAHGKRSGAAAGRSKLWAALANLADVGDLWPYPAGELGEFVNEAKWWTWDADRATGMWNLHLAVVQASTEVAFAIRATDHE